MGWICEDCGQEDSFRGTQETTQYVTEEIFLDGEGEIHDWGDQETNDSETNEGPENIQCQECDSDNCNWYESESELEEIRNNAQLKTEGVKSWKDKVSKEV